MARYKITIEYDGTNYFGWQRQSGLPTIQQKLEEVLFPLTKAPVTIYGAGRTDAGVHALGQVAHFDMPIKGSGTEEAKAKREIDPLKIRECMNAHLRDEAISILSVEQVEENFDARFSARERTYLYKILNRRAPPALEKNRVWHVMKPLDTEKMHKAAQCLVGRHDFSSFRAIGCQSNSPIKTLNSIKIYREGDMIFAELKARSFLYHQVRNIIGSLFMVGKRSWTAEDFQQIFEQKDRTKAGQTAPACGLYFVSVSY